MGEIKPLKGDRSNKTGSIERSAKTNDYYIMNSAGDSKITKCLILVWMLYGSSI
jgi:hypothetical protein